LLGAIGWTWCFAVAKTWSRKLTWLSIAVWGDFAFAVVILLLPPRWRPPPIVAAIANALAYVLFQLWLIGVTEGVLRRSRPIEAQGKLSEWRSPRCGSLGRLTEFIANSRFLRAICEWLPFVPLVSDVTDVVYINYLVPHERLEPLIPPGLFLQRLGTDGAYAMFSILTYRHGHFGPPLPRWLRGAFASPVQSNWRVYVTDAQSGTPGVYFVATAINSTLYALAARLLTEGVAMHVPESANVNRDGMAVQVSLVPGRGTSPDLRATFRSEDGPGATAALPAPWSECFADGSDILSYVVPQDRAWSAQPWYGRMTRQEIDLKIPLESCLPLEGPVKSHAAENYVGDAQPVSFLVPRLAFRLESQTSIPAAIKPQSSDKRSAMVNRLKPSQ
jgi:hypothetical protein